MLVRAGLGLLCTLGDPGIRKQPQSHAHKVTHTKHEVQAQGKLAMGTSSELYPPGRPSSTLPLSYIRNFLL